MDLYACKRVVYSNHITFERSVVTSISTQHFETFFSSSRDRSSKESNSFSLSDDDNYNYEIELALF